MTPKWLVAWRALAPKLSTNALHAIQHAMETDAPELVQGVTVSPPPGQAGFNEAPCGACLIGYAGWKGDGLTTVLEVEDYFVRHAREIGQELGERSQVRWLTCWFDAEPRAEVFAALLPEIRAELFRRGANCPVHAG